MQMEESGAPVRIAIGRCQTKKVNQVDIFSDFFEAFAHRVYERCSGKKNKEEMEFGEYTYNKCADDEFASHIDESALLSRKYMLAKRLYAFEVVVVKKSEEQLIGFRVCLKQLENSPDIEVSADELYLKLYSVLDSISDFKFPTNVEVELHSCKFRLRVRLLTRLRNSSKRQIDSSTPPQFHQTFPISDSVAYNSNLMVFSVHM